MTPRDRNIRDEILDCLYEGRWEVHREEIDAYDAEVNVILGALASNWNTETCLVSDMSLVGHFAETPEDFQILAALVGEPVSADETMLSVAKKLKEKQNG